MDAFLYLAKTSGLIALFYVAYWLLLKKETFFNPNRWFLLAGLITAALLPMVTYTKVVWIEAKPVTTLIINAQDLNTNNINALQQHAALAHAQIVQAETQINWQDIALAVYIIGALLLLARFLTDVSFIRELLKAHKATKHGRYRLIDSPQVQSPFSFFNYIVYNSAAFTATELESILEHEKVHSRQLHSLDMIIGQLFCVILWFNPFVWLYKKAIAQNLEFIADAGAAQKVTDAVGYQKTLLKITLQPECIAITNHFYQSLIKKRIVMLNKKKSSSRSSWKYGVVLPALVTFVLAFQVKVVAQEKETETLNVVKADVLITHSPTQDRLVVKIDKDTKDSELEERKRTIKDEFDADVAFSNIKRNDKSEITAIKVAFKGKNNDNVYELKGNKPIKAFTIEINSKGNNDYIINFGTPKDIAAFYPSDDNNDTVIFNANPYTHTPAPPQAFVHRPALVYGTAQPIITSGNRVALNFGNSDALIVINGVKYAKGQEIKLPAGHQVTAITTLNDKEGKSKYGKEGKKGVIEIIASPAKAQLSDDIAFGYMLPDDLLNSISEKMNIETSKGLLNSDLMDKFPFEIFDGVTFGENGFEGLTPEKQKEIEQKLMAFVDLEKVYFSKGSDIERLKAEKMREEVERQRNHLKNRLEDNRQVLEAKRNEVEKIRAEKEKKKAEMIKRREELKRKAEAKKNAEAKEKH
ncbi:M56 family metallopeptidase [Flavobacterium akiainvivens]|nr:M56 family metallopeptidase [Flavobacterium akiainvivens]SFQ51169.1 BlaR1 peptidase M56 [Flavobacterium akiainvivens]